MDSHEPEDLMGNRTPSKDEWSASPLNPYVGLRPFREKDTDIFFGRSEQILELLTRLKHTRFVAVVGTSGSGKSSLVLAGLIPRLQGGWMLGRGPHWRIARFQPGDRPMSRLASAMHVALREEKGADLYETVRDVETAIRSNSQGLADAIRGCNLAPNQNILIVVDQFEELFRYGEQVDSKVFEDTSNATDTTGELKALLLREDEAEAFVRRLLAASSASDLPVYVLITMRSEFLGDCNRVQGLPEAVNKGLYLTPRLTRIELSEAIMNPLAMREGTISSSLVQRLLNDISHDPDQLPILQHALMRTWHGPAHIDESDYEKEGGTAGALSQHATHIWEDLDNRGRVIAELVFRALTKPGPDAKGLRRPLRLSEICKAANRRSEEILEVIERFRSPGNAFLQPPFDEIEKLDPAKDPIIDISHESLIRKWDKLQDWIRSESKSGDAYERLLKLALLNQNNAGSFLLREGELRDFLEHKRVDRWNSSWSQRYGGRYAVVTKFLQESRQALRARRLQEKRQKEHDIQADLDKQQAEFEAERRASALKAEQRRIEDRQAERERLRKYLLWGVAVYLLLVTATAFLLTHIFVRVRDEQKADALEAQSVQKSSQYGSSTQEMAALLAIASIQAAPRPSNANVTAWESFGKLRRGAPVPVKTATTVDAISPVEQLAVFGEADAYRIATIYRPNGLAAIPPTIFESHTMRVDTSFTKFVAGGITAISLDGIFATGHCRNNWATVWNLERRKPSIKIPCQRDPNVVSHSQDGSTLATLEYVEDRGPGKPLVGILRVFGTTDGKQLLIRTNVMSQAFSPNGNYLAIVYTTTPSGEEITPENISVDLIDLSRSKVGSFIDNYLSTSAAISFSPDGHYLAIGKSDGSIDLYDISKRLMLPPGLPSHGAAITALSFNHKSTLLASAGEDNVVRVMEFRQPRGLGGHTQERNHKRKYPPDFGSLARTLWSDDFGRPASQLVFSNDDRFIGLAVGEKTARFKDANTGFERVRVTHDTRVTSVAFSPDGDTAFSVGDTKNGEMFKSNVEDGDRPPESILLDCSQPQQVSLSADGTVAAVSCPIQGDDSSSENPGAHSSQRQSEIVTPMALTYRLSKLQSDPLTILHREVILQGKAFPASSKGSVCQVVLSADGSLSIAKCVGGGNRDEIEAYDLRKRKRVPLSVPKEFFDTSTQPGGSGSCKPHSLVSLALDYAGSKVAIGDDCGRYGVYLLDRKTAVVTLKLEDKVRSVEDAVGAFPITALSFSPSGTMIAAGNSRGCVSFHTEGRKDISRCPYDSAVSAIEFSSIKTGDVDSKVVLIVSGVTASILERVTYSTVSQITVASSITAQAISKSAQYVALGSEDGSVNILDLRSPSGPTDRIESSFLKIVGYDTRLDPWFGPHLMATWSVPPSLKSSLCSPQFAKIQSLRFLSGGKLLVGQSQSLLLEDSDKGRGFAPLFAITQHDYLRFLDKSYDRQKFCPELRADTSVSSSINYSTVCESMTWTEKLLTWVDGIRQRAAGPRPASAR